MAFVLFKSFFDTVDEATATFVHDISTRCIVEVTPIVTVALTLSFISYGLLVMRGAVGMPATEFLGKAFRIAIIVNIALAGGLYQSEIAGLIRTLPDDLATALIVKPSQGATAASLVDEAAGVGFDCAGMAFNKAGIFSFEGLTYCVIGVLVSLMTGVLVAVGGGFLLMSKVALSVLAGLGPLFIVALIFPATARFFDLWLGQVVNYTLLVVLYAAVFGLMMAIYKKYMTGFAFDGVVNISHALGGVCILSFSMLIILRQLPSIASSLSGGAALNFASGIKVSRSQQKSPSRTSSEPLISISRSSSVSANAASSPAQTQGRQPKTSSRLASYGYYKGQSMKGTNSD
jgi:type IV secretion system protein VirB6